MNKRYPLTLVLLFLLFALSFAVIFYGLKGTIATQFDASAPDLLGLRNFGMLQGGETRTLFETWGALAGVGLGIIALILSLVLWGISAVLQIGKYVVTKFIVALLSFGLLLAFGYELMFLEERTTILVRSVIFYVGFPLWYAALITVAAILLVGIVSFIKKNPETKKLVLLLAVLVPVLSGCNLLSSLTSTTCSLGVDATHCNQEAAISGNDEGTCAKVQAPKEFKDAGSNPPQDKCYMIVAENKKDPAICNKMKGGFASYEKGDCVQEIAVGTENYDLCGKGATSLEGCTQKIIDIQQKKFSELAQKIQQGSPADPATLQEMQLLTEQMNKFYGMMTNIEKEVHDSNMAVVRNLK